MTNSTKTRPLETLRDGALKATIWKQDGEHAPFYRVNLTRSYRDDAGNWHDTDSFTGSDLLKVALLATRAYERTSALRQEDRNAPVNAESELPNDGRQA